MISTSGFAATEEELGLVAQIYDFTGSPRGEFINGDALASFFTPSVKLSPDTIGTIIWDIVDEEQSGYLSETGVAIALRLVGWAQSGEEVNTSLINSPGPSPQINGFPSIKSQSSSPVVAADFPPFTERERDEFYKLFEECGPVYGLLEGDKARDAFLMFDLSAKDLWKIWDIADTRKRGALDKYDFALAMYLIQGIQSGRLTSIPTTTPTQIFEQILAMSPQSPFSSSLDDSKGKFKSEKSSRKSSSPSIIKPPLGSLNTSHSPHKTVYDSDWDINPANKAVADEYFDALDAQKVGYLGGDVVAAFMLESKLKPEDLAQIWDLADINHDNYLSRDEFAIAMHLIQERSKGVDLPIKLPSYLIPPSLRTLLPDTPLRRAATSPNLSKKPHILVKPKPPTRSPPLPPMVSTSPRSPNKRNSTISPTLLTKAPPSSHSPSNRNSIASSTFLPKVITTPQTPSNRSSFSSSDFLPSVPTSPRSPSVRNSVAIPNNMFLNSPRSPPRLPAEPIQPEPRPPTVDHGQFQILQAENAFLSSKVEQLTSQLNTLRDVQSANTTLENQTLISKILEMEQITSEVLRINAAHPAVVADLTEKNELLTRQIAGLEEVQSQLDETTRKLGSSVQENKDLSAYLRDTREAAAAQESRSSEEITNMTEKVGLLESDNSELRKRTQDMERAISRSQPSNSTTNVQELELLLGDVTRENEGLKERLREMQRSTADLVLTSSTGHATNDALRRDNQRLSTQVAELEDLVKQLQKSSEDIELQRVLRDVTQENDTLKADLREIRLQVRQLESAGSSRVAPLQAEISQLKGEIRRLQTELHDTASRAPHEDPSIPPPAYED